MEAVFMNDSGLAWMIHGPSLPQMVGAAGEAVVFHCESAATTQMR